MYKFLFFFSSICISSCAFAIDLRDSLVSAYNNQEDFKVARQTFLTSIEQFPQALSAFLPDVSAGVSSSVNKQKSYSRFSNNPASETTQLQRSAQITQSVFNGGADMAALKAAQAAFKAARGTFYNSEQTAMLNAIQAYLNAYATEQKYHNADASVKSNEKQLEAAEEKLKLGESTITDVANARAGLASARAAKFNAYAAMQAARSDFVRIFNEEPESIDLPAIPEGLPDSLDTLTKHALAANPAMEVGRNTVEAGRANALAAKGNLLPKVNFSVSAGRNFNDAGFNNPNSLSVTSALSLNVPIYSRGGADYSRARQAASNARLAVAQFDSQTKQLKANCVNSWESFNAAKSRVVAAKEAVDAGELAYEGVMQEEIVGSKTMLDVLDTESRLLNARNTKVDVDTSYVLAAYQMQALMGRLTAKSLKLPVKYFEPEREFKKVKLKIIGF